MFENSYENATLAYYIFVVDVQAQYCSDHDSLPLRSTSTRNIHLSVILRLWEITAPSSFSDQILHYMGSGEGL